MIGLAAQAEAILERLSLGLPSTRLPGGDLPGGGLRPAEVATARAVFGVAEARPEIFGQVDDDVAGCGTSAAGLDFAAAEVAFAQWEALRRLGDVLERVVSGVSTARRDAGEEVRAVVVPAYAIAQAVAAVDPKVARMLAPAMEENHRPVAERKRRQRPQKRLAKQEALVAEADAQVQRALERRQRVAAEAAGSTPRSGAVKESAGA